MHDFCKKKFGHYMFIAKDIISLVIMYLLQLKSDFCSICKLIKALWIRQACLIIWFLASKIYNFLRLDKPLSQTDEFCFGVFCSVRIIHFFPEFIFSLLTYFTIGSIWEVIWIEFWWFRIRIWFKQDSKIFSKKW